MDISDLSKLKNKEKVNDLRGWVDTIRHHGGLMFFELRDHETKVQIVTDNPEQFDNLKNEFYVSVTGILVKRKKENVNKEVLFGDLEIELSNLEIISESKTLPFQIEDNIETDEQIRLKHRYLDIRRKEMNNNIIARSNTFKSIREVMNKLNINELDTPTLIKSTPEGAKDFIVPSRKSPGSFYALPQSPQMYKQLFMLSGLKNYYQIAKCYRDEDSRKDRQPEFTQLDIEISNGDPKIVQKIIESTMKHVLKTVYSIEVKTPFTKITYDEAMSLYGTDKPDLRIKETITDFTNIFMDTEISFIKETIKNNGTVRGFLINNLLSRSEIDNLDELFTIGLNRAITLIAEAKPGRISSSLIKDLGEHPDDKKPVRIMKGQYGPYIKYKSLNATIPEEKDPTELTMEEALILIEKRKEYDKNKKKRKK